MELFKLFGRIMIEDDAANKSLQRIDNQAENTGNRFGKLGQLGSKVGGLIVAGAAAATAAVGALSIGVGKVGISYNAMMEQSQVAWTTLLGSQKEAKDMLQDISDFTKATPFETEDVDMMAKYMHNAGLEGKVLFDELLKISDTASAFAIPAAEAKEMTRQMSQVRQAGVAYTEDLNILQDRGVPIYKAIAKQLGITTGEVKQMASEGELTADIYLKAFDSIAKGVEGASEAQSKTFNGMISTLKDNLKMIAGELTEGLFGRLKGGFEQVMPILDTFLENLKTGGIREAILGLIPPEILERLTSFANTAQTAFAKVKEFSMPIIQEVVGFVMGKVSELKAFWDENGAQIVEACKVAFEGIKAIVEFVMPAVFLLIQTVWENIKGVISGAIDTIMGIIKLLTGLLTGDFSLAWEGIKQTVLGAIETVWNLFNLIMLGKFLGGISTFITKGAGLFKSFASDVGTVFKGWVDDALSLFNNLKTKGTSIWNSIVQAIENTVGPFVANIKSLFKGLVDDAVSNFNKVKTAMMNPIKTARDAVKGYIDDIKGFFNGLKLKLPNIKTPHFKLKNWSSNPLDWVKSMPSIGIDWYAKGTNYAPGGLAVVGERGPELVHLPRGSKVDTANETRNKLGTGIGTLRIEPVPIMVDSYELARIVFPEIDLMQASSMSGQLRLSGVKG